MTHSRFPSSATAEAYIHAIGGSSIYTSGGRPRLPNCGAPKFAVPEDNYRPVKGKSASCECVTRDNPLPGCPWLTERHSEIIELEGEFLVYIDPREVGITAETVDGIRLNHIQASVLSHAEVHRARIHWPIRESAAEYAQRRSRRQADGQDMGVGPEQGGP